MARSFIVMGLPVIVNLIRTGDGVAPKDIADELHVSRATIDSHRRNIMKKLRFDDAHKFQAFAVRKRMLW